jgi:hypothetical protein
MKKYNKYSILGLKALQRAAKKVAEDAKRNQYKIPFWKNGKVVYEMPEMFTEQIVSSDIQG